jgi:hypothetical protein
MTSGDPNPVEWLNQVVALAADVPGCQSCDAETEMVPTAAGTYVLAVHHDSDCPWLAERVSGPEDTYQNKRHFTMNELTEVKRTMNGDNDNE